MEFKKGMPGPGRALENLNHFTVLFLVLSNLSKNHKERTATEHFFLRF